MLSRFIALLIAALNMGGATVRAIHCEWGWMIFQLVSAFIMLNAALPGGAWSALVDSFLEPLGEWAQTKMNDRHHRKEARAWQRSHG